jgi:hypothetical protein
MSDACSTTPITILSQTYNSGSDSLSVVMGVTGSSSQQTFSAANVNPRAADAPSKLGAVIGGVVGGIIAIAAVGGLVYYFAVIRQPVKMDGDHYVAMNVQGV